LHLIAGPNGAGKTTFYEEILGPATWLPFINADMIARERWPEDPVTHAYEAAAEAAALRQAAIEEGRSFRPVARYLAGRMVGSADWPPWTPPELKEQ
jgi:predicted ABC-type ATPase